MDAVTLEIGDREYALFTDDAYLHKIARVFEPEMPRLFAALARGVALDIGANVGCTALALSQQCLRVHAFEPSPSTVALLAQNVRDTDNVTVHPFGLSDRHQRVELTFAPDNRSGAYISDLARANGYNIHETVELFPLDKVARRIGLTALDFVKIDVEGFEGHVLRGARKTLARHRPAAVLELNHWCLNVFRRVSVPDFLDQLRATFPLLYAVQDDTYLDLHDPDEAYVVMHRHLVHRQYANLVGAFTADQVAAFAERYRHTAELQ